MIITGNAYLSDQFECPCMVTSFQFSKCLLRILSFLGLSILSVRLMSMCQWQILGEEIGTIYSRQKLKRLIAIQVESSEAQLESGLTQDDSYILAGALEYKVGHHSKTTNLLS